MIAEERWRQRKTDRGTERQTGRQRGRETEKQQKRRTEERLMGINNSDDKFTKGKVIDEMER